MTNPSDRPVPWREAFDFDAQPADHYLDYWNEPVLSFVAGPPARVLDAGCAGGMLGLKIKERFPGAHVTGIEAGRAAAQRAATRLDHVIARRLEEVDFEAEGLGPGTLDLVVAADVLEHLVDPWGFLAKVRPLLAPGGLLVASIPNVRNLNLVLDLVLDGRWRYASRGLLDVTHLRFFTLGEMRRLFEDTGYRVERHGVNLSASLEGTWRQIEGRDRIDLASGRFSLTGVDREELAELCAEQFILACRVA